MITRELLPLQSGHITGGFRSKKQELIFCVFSELKFGQLTSTLKKLLLWPWDVSFLLKTESIDNLTHSLKEGEKNTCCCPWGIANSSALKVWDETKLLVFVDCRVQGMGIHLALYEFLGRKCHTQYHGWKEQWPVLLADHLSWWWLEVTCFQSYISIQKHWSKIECKHSW